VMRTEHATAAFVHAGLGGSDNRGNDRGDHQCLTSGLYFLGVLVRGFEVRDARCEFHVLRQYGMTGSLS
jgi:hypothetical protein